MRNHRLARAAVVGATAFALVPTIGISPAHACSCVGRDDAQSFEAADVVFRGTLPAGTVTGRGDSDPVVLTFAADRVYKGTAYTAQKVSTSASGASCGLEISGAGPFLVFASDPRDEDGTAPEVAPGTVPVPEASLCGGTRELRADETPPFGPGHPADAAAGVVFALPAADPGRWATVLPVAFGVLIVALLAVPVVIRRRRRPEAPGA
jgi:hypothetical protein